MHVGVIGLGYVGLTLAVHMANKGFKVTGIEKNPYVLESLEGRNGHFFEPNLDRYLDRHLDNNIVVKKQLSECDSNPDIFVISVGTPIKNDVCDLTAIETIAEDLLEVLQGQETVILRSTVKIGTTDWLSDKIKKKFPNASVAFCPERTLEGKALEELNYLPQIIGANDMVAKNKASALFQRLTDSIVIVSNSKTAEMIKLTDNSQRDVWFAYSNEIAIACDNVGVNAMEVIKSGAKGYERSNLAIPGPVGGPCLSKDPHILVESIAASGIEMGITKASRDTNERVLFHGLDSIISFFANKEMPENVTICGMAFKGTPPTNDLRGSPSVDLVNLIIEQMPYATVHLYDPNCRLEELNQLGFNVVKTLDDAFEGKDLVILATNSEHNKSIDLPEVSKKMRDGGLIYDFWNMHTTYSKLSLDVAYIALGQGSEGNYNG